MKFSITMHMHLH